MRRREFIYVAAVLHATSTRYRTYASKCGGFRTEHKTKFSRLTRTATTSYICCRRHQTFSGAPGSGGGCWGSATRNLGILLSSLGIDSRRQIVRSTTGA